MDTHDRYRLLTWDYKDQPPLSDILTAFQELVDYDYVPEFVLPDTGGDYYAVIVSERELTSEQVERILESGDKEGTIPVEPVSGQWDSPGTSPEEEDA